MIAEFPLHRRKPFRTQNVCPSHVIQKMLSKVNLTNEYIKEKYFLNECLLYKPLNEFPVTILDEIYFQIFNIIVIFTYEFLKDNY